MHFFTDHTQLIQQTELDSFGTDSVSPLNKYNITSKFQLSEQAKAFACQDGMMIIQQSVDDESLVNLIIKPIKGLKIPFNIIQYYVYRGVLKDSFITESVIKPKTEALDNSFLKRFWEDVESFRINMNLPDHPDPTPKELGYDNLLSENLNIKKIYDNSQEETFAVYVKEGEWIGDFGTTQKIGFEIITETDKINMPESDNAIDLSYLRKLEHTIDVSGLSGLEKRAKQDLILSYIDPAAFFGLYYDLGINISVFDGANKTLVSKKKEELYVLLENFSTKNRVYLDIRSETGYSYNFYQNYGDSSGKNIKLGNSLISPVSQVYGHSEWPIVAIENPINTTNNFNDAILNLRIDDNTKPILFIEYPELHTNDLRKRFIDDTNLLDGASTDWSKDIKLKFPNTGSGASKNNIAYYIRLYYNRQERNSSSPNTVIAKDNPLDNLFGSLNMLYLGDIEYTFQHSTSEDPVYSKGEVSSQEFSGVFRQQANFDAQRVVFVSEMMHSHKITTLTPYPDTTLGRGNGIDLEGNFNQMSRLKRDMYHYNQTIQEEIGVATYQSVTILGISNYNGFPSRKENLYILGLMQSELTELKNVTGLSNLHDRYIVFEDVSATPALDKDGKSYQKYKLKVQGLDANDIATFVLPSTDIFVYTDKNFMLCSKAFAENEPLGDSAFYERNYEEKIGFENREPNTNKRYEDWFIEKDSGMQVEVDGFINALSLINNDADFYSHVKALVEDSAEDIWNQAVSTVQANNNANPDDRPLYWGRIKMQVALKSHPYFNDGVNNTDLEKLIELFEEKSRNYTGVDFSNAPVGAKKILITGFDPFLLNEKHPFYGNSFNIKQSNPSGCVALALHNTLTQNGIGYIQTMIVPVRYTDFDGSKNSASGQGKGIIEKYIKPWIDKVNMIITISQAGPDEYHIDKFATATRGGFVDNMNFERVPNSRSINITGKSELEWIKTTLPNQFIQQPVILSNEYTDKYGVKHNVNNIGNDVPIIGEQMLSGPGGDYLSNEIFYRVAKLREDWIKSKLPEVKTKATGHFHIAKLQDGYAKDDFNIPNTQVLLNIVRTAINNGVTGI